MSEVSFRHMLDRASFSLPMGQDRLPPVFCAHYRQDRQTPLQSWREMLVSAESTMWPYPHYPLPEIQQLQTVLIAVRVNGKVGCVNHHFEGREQQPGEQARSHHSRSPKTNFRMSEWFITQLYIGSRRVTYCHEVVPQEKSIHLT